MNTIRLMLALLTMILLAGCRCPTPNNGIKKAEDMSVITVTVDADQNFVFGGKRLSVEAFFTQTELDQHSRMVYLDVEPKSAMSEETVIRAIKHLESRNYRVMMMEGSKYEELNRICKK